MSRVDSEFKNRVYQIVASIPSGRVVNYGQIAALAGVPIAAWEVGQIAHSGPNDLPWQRVLTKSGGLARVYPGGGYPKHKNLLEAEGIKVQDDFKVDMEVYQCLNSEIEIKR